MSKKLISVILPCHNESENIPDLVPLIIKNVSKKYDYEIILVDDGSFDNTLDEIIKIAKKNKKVKGVFFHRNFGHQAALIAGIRKAKGAAVITMDADFQHPPKIIPALISAWEKGSDLVLAQKKEDNYASFSRKLERKIGYFIWDKFSGGLLKPGVSDFRLMNSEVARYVSRSTERSIFLRGVVKLGARNIVYIKYKVAKRKYGKSSYTTKMFINMFINGFVSFSTFPLRIAFLLGLLISLLSGAYLIFDIILGVLLGRSIIQGWISVITLVLLMNGIVLLYLGLLGEYISVIFKEVKKRPRYLITKTINFN